MSGKSLQRFVLLAGLASFAFAAPARAVLVDIAGYDSGTNASGIFVNEDENFWIDRIGFWFEVEAKSPSTLEELQISVQLLDGSDVMYSYTLNEGYNGGEGCGFNGGYGPAECDVVMTFAEFEVSVGDQWYIQFGGDALYGAGSIIAWGDDLWRVSASKVPEPSTLALFAIALAGLGFFMTRRRRVV